MTAQATNKKTPPKEQKPNAHENGAESHPTPSEPSAHMGATEEQVIPIAPPTEALEKLIDPPGKKSVPPATDDELTPG